jgi:hypothetical protein
MCISVVYREHTSDDFLHAASFLSRHYKYSGVVLGGTESFPFVSICGTISTWTVSSNVAPSSTRVANRWFTTITCGVPLPVTFITRLVSTFSRMHSVAVLTCSLVSMLDSSCLVIPRGVTFLPFVLHVTFSSKPISVKLSFEHILFLFISLGPDQLFSELSKQFSGLLNGTKL